MYRSLSMPKVPTAFYTAALIAAVAAAGCGGNGAGAASTGGVTPQHVITFSGQDLGTSAFSAGNIPWVSLNSNGKVIVGRGSVPGSPNAILIDSGNPTSPIDLGVQLANVYISDSGTMAGDLNSETNPQMAEILTTTSAYQVPGEVYNLTNSGVALVNNVGTYATYNASGPVSVLPPSLTPFAIAQGVGGTMYALGQSGLDNYAWVTGQSAPGPGAFGSYQELEINDRGDVLTTNGLLESFSGGMKSAAPNFQIGGNAGWSQPNLSSNANEQVIGSVFSDSGYVWNVYDFTWQKAFPITVPGYTIARAGAINSNNQFLVDAVPTSGSSRVDHLLLVTETRQ